MEELNQFLNSVEASARRIIKQQNKKQQEQLVRDRAALTRAAKNGGVITPGSSNTVSVMGSPTKSVTREVLKATYSPGGALIVHAPPTPTSPLKSPTNRRSEHDDGVPQATVLPRLPPSPVGDISKAVVSIPPYLPSIDRPRPSKEANQTAINGTMEAAKKAQREKRTADKILNSPLYKSLAKSKSEPQGFANSTSSIQAVKKTLHDVDHVNLLLKKLGLRDNSSPTRRPDHAVEKRMCNACWASPNKLTGCEHHARVVPSTNNNALAGLSEEAQMLRQMELQGPTSWLSDDLFVKYRSESDRERLWHAFCRLKEAQEERERLGNLSDVPVIPIIVRHPIIAKFYTQVELENLKTQAETRRRNLSKAFIFDVNHIWLTNLDHFNARLLRAQRQRQRKIAHLQSQANGAGVELGITSDDDEEENQDDGAVPSTAELTALRDRRDEAAIREGYCQIQSISTTRALQNAIFPTIDTITVPRQSSSASITLNVTPTSPTVKRRRRPREQPFKVPPLTLLVCGAWNPKDPLDSSALERVPGVAVVGAQRVLWWRYPHDDSSTDYTKAVAIFARSTSLSSSNTILVSLVLALDTPVVTPIWFAWHIGSKMPPPQLYETPHTILQPPQLISPHLTSLLSMKLQTRIDTLLPGTVMLLSSVPHADDLILELDEPYDHRRFWTEFHSGDAFRQWWLIDKRGVVVPNYDVDPQYVRVQIAQPNATSVGGRFTWHAIDPIAHHLNRPRKEKDYVYIIDNHLTCGSNGAIWFIVSMTHEVVRDVAAAKLADHLQMLEDRRRQKEYEEKLMEIEKKIEIGRLQLEAKRQEQKRIEEELTAKAAMTADHFNTNKMAETTLLEWEERLQSSIVVNEQVGWQRREITEDQSQVIFYYSLNEALPRAHRFCWGKPVIWPVDEEDDDGSGRSEASLTSRSDASSSSSSSSQSDDDGLSEDQRKLQEAVTQMATALLADEQFLCVLKAKLGIDSDDDHRHQRRKSTKRPGDDGDDDEDTDADRLDLKDHMIMLTEEQDRSKASLMATKMVKLSLPSKSIKQMHQAKPGEGWKRLKVSQLPKSFARSVYSTRTEGPRSSFINQTNHPTPVGMIDPRESSPYEPPDFIPELKVLRIPKPSMDLQEKKMQWAEYLATHPADGEEAVVVSSSAGKVSAKDALFEKDPAERDQTMEQLVAKALLCSRNNNLQGLEAALDGGCDVNARDNHGNSLFILVCQQGNKKITKFLMRRHADMNLQNLNGNTALHYLIEYKHTDLADYIKSKGAIDTIQNAAGLTCYEGLSLEHVEAI